MKVGYVLKMFPRLSETFVLNELVELERQGVDVHVFSLKRPDEQLFHRDVARLRAPVSYAPDLGQHVDPRVKHRRQAASLAPLVRRAGVQHVHAHFASGATSVALHVHRLTGVPFSFTAHAKDIYTVTVRPQDLARKLRTAQFAVTVSDYNAEYLRALAPDSRLVRIYNGLDLSLFSRNGAVPAAPPLVLGVGRLVEKKGFGDLVRACAVLRDRGVFFQCRIVGKGPLAKELRALVRELGLRRAVELSGPLPREELIGLYRRAAVVAAPCLVAADGNRDGLPTVLVEALALGLPVVSTPVTGIPELVEDGRTGLLVPERDPEALAGALDRLLADRARAGALALEGRRRVERAFDLRRNVARLRELFEEATAS